MATSTERLAAAIAIALLAAGRATSSAAEPWWTMRFPPRAIAVEKQAPPSFDPARVIEGLACGNFDTARVPDEGGVLLSGWAYDPRHNVPARGIVILDGERPLPRRVPVYRERIDIAMHLGNTRALLPTGWTLWIPADRIAPGRHVFTAYAELEDGKLARIGEREVTVPSAVTK